MIVYVWRVSLVVVQSRNDRAFEFWLPSLRNEGRKLPVAIIRAFKMKSTVLRSHFLFFFYHEEIL